MDSAQVADRSNEQPADSAFRLLVVGEIVAAHSFVRRRLYVEYRILHDPRLWQLVVSGRRVKDTTCPRPGVIRVCPLHVYGAFLEEGLQECMEAGPCNGKHSLNWNH